MENVISNNELFLTGKVLENLKEHHQRREEKFYSFCLGIPRHSGIIDKIQVLCSNKLLQQTNIVKGDYISLTGQLRTYDVLENGRKKLLIFAYVKTVEKINKEQYDLVPNKNIVKIKGNLCKEPNNRVTATRIITDLLIACNRSYHRSDYIPCIAWGTNAYYSKAFSIGNLVKIEGRLQSREGKERTYYDLSINNIIKIDEEVTVDEPTNN